MHYKKRVDILYYIGVVSDASSKVLMDQGATIAFANIFSSVGGTFLNICIVISCLGAFKRFILPIVSIMACLFMIFAAIYAHGITPYLNAKENGQFALPVLFYLIVFAVIMFAGKLLMGKKNTVSKE